MRRKRSRAKRVTIFNHKGGVGKTILTVNIAAALGEMGKKVLLVDSDPQCNLTAYVIAPEVVDDLLNNSGNRSGKTLWSALRPINDGTGQLRLISPIETPQRNVYLLPGDIQLSNFESELNSFWTDCLARRVRGFVGTLALSELVNAAVYGKEFDYIFYDVGPNIGPLNRVVLLDCDWFIVPAALDVFSMRALTTLGRTIVDWIRLWRTILDSAPVEMTSIPGFPRYLGYIPQRFRVVGGVMSEQDAIFLQHFELHLKRELVDILRGYNRKLAPTGTNEYRLGNVPDFGQLVQISQEQGVPISEVDTRDTAGHKSNGAALKADAKRVFKKIARKIVDLTRER
jgi:cellulose biosynthesis protein BcsQ